MRALVAANWLMLLEPRAAPLHSSDIQSREHGAMTSKTVRPVEIWDLVRVDSGRDSRVHKWEVLQWRPTSGLWRKKNEMATVQ